MEKGFRRSYWLPTHSFVKWPEKGTQVLFVIKDKKNRIKLSSGIIANKDARTVREHGTNKIRFPYLSELISVNTEIKEVKVMLD